VAAVTSTVLDVCVFLLLVGAAAGTLVAVPAPADHDAGDRADAVATTLATTTATVEYSLSPGAERARDSPVAFGGTPTGAAYERVEHGSLARLLAVAAVADASLDGRPLSHTRRGYVDAVLAESNATLAGLAPGVGVGVTVRWAPYAASATDVDGDVALAGTVVAGERPPATATVHAATFAVPSGLPSAREAAVDRSQHSHGYRPVAQEVALAVVRGVLPVTETRSALRGRHPEDALAAYRAMRLASVVGADVAEPLQATRVATVGSRLVAALADRIAADMRERFRRPGAAARSVAVDHVTVVVRTWSV
jgi:hypothetical protein